MPVQLIPYPLPPGNTAPWLLAYPPFPRPQNAATQAPLPNPPRSSPAAPGLAWPCSIALPPSNVSSIPGMPLRSRPYAASPGPSLTPTPAAMPPPGALAPTGAAAYAGHVSPAVAAYQDALFTDVVFRSQNTIYSTQAQFYQDQAKMSAVLQKKMGTVNGNPVFTNGPDYHISAPAQQRRLDGSGLDAYNCYDKSPSPYDGTMQHLRRIRGQQAVQNHLQRLLDRVQTPAQYPQQSIQPGMTTGTVVYG